MDLTEKKISSPFGPIYLYASSKGLAGCYFSKKKLKTSPPDNKAKKHLNSATKILTSYFKGKPINTSTLSLDLEGTPFQKRVWKELSKIRSGKTLSYGELARKVGSPRAARAVGSACGANPLLIINPCHRVLASNGELGGFAAGLPKKKQLLKHELTFEKRAGGA